jgi:hypothetical protein
MARERIEALATEAGYVDAVAGWSPHGPALPEP